MSSPSIENYSEIISKILSVISYTIGMVLFGLDNVLSVLDNHAPGFGVLIGLGTFVMNFGFLKNNATIKQRETTSMIYPKPKGVYNLIGARMYLDMAAISNPAVAGVVLRDKWPLIEPVRGQYDWSYLDDAIAKMATTGKPIMLCVITGSSIGSPAWLAGLGVKMITFTDGDGVNQTIPAPWDAKFLAEKKRFIRQLGKRYAANKQIVSVNAHAMNFQTDDWFVPATATDVTNLLAAGYTTDIAIDACTQIITATMSAFPNQVVRMPIGRINVAFDTVLKDADYVSKMVIEWALSTYPDRFYAQRHNLNARVPDPTLTTKLEGWQVLYDARPNIAAQMVWMASDVTSCRMNGNVKPCDAGQMLASAGLIADHYGMQYLEIYQADLQNPALADEIDAIATRLADN